MKRCGCCKIEKPLTDFYRDRSFKDGFRQICKICNKISMNRWQSKYSGIYKITSNNITLYVGQSKRVNERMSKHRSCLRNPQIAVKHIPTQSYLYPQLLNYSNLQVEIIEYCDINILLEREKYWQNQLKPLY